MKVRLMGMLLMMLAGWINRHQQDGIMYLKEENKVLREKLGTGILKIRVSLVQDRRVLMMVPPALDRHTHPCFSVSARFNL